MGRASRLNPFQQGRSAILGKVYRVTVNIRVNEIAIELIPVAMGQVSKTEKTLMVQVTEAAGEGDSPKAAVAQAMENGIAAYLEGLGEAGDKVSLLAPGLGEVEGH